MKIERSFLNDNGLRKSFIDIKSSEGSYKVILTDNQQIHYHESNECVWLSAYLLIWPQDSQLTEYLLSGYNINCKAYALVCIHKKGGRPRLNTYLKNENNWYLDVCRVNTSEEYSNNVTCYIISGITKGFFIVVLQDTSGVNSYKIGINRAFEC